MAISSCAGPLQLFVPRRHILCNEAYFRAEASRTAFQTDFDSNRAVHTMKANILVGGRPSLGHSLKQTHRSPGLGAIDDRPVERAAVADLLEA